MKHPSVTIIMPVRNEAAYIERSLSSVLAQTYSPERLEVLVADGMSDDDTRARVTSLAGHHPVTVRLLDNPERTVPFAMNRALREAKGEIIVRVDGHCEIPPDYVSRCVALLAQTGADCVGGCLETLGETAMARAIALAQSSRFGVGSATFRTGSAEAREVDTLAFGAYRQAVFERIGNFDEELTRNQDDEFNLRLTQGGGRIWLEPAITVRYYSRASLSGLWRQYYQYGLYKVLVIRKRGGLASWRHLVPALFVLALTASTVLALATRESRWLGLVAGPYVLANLAASALTARLHPRLMPRLPAIFAILHLSYGLGFLRGLTKWRR